MSDFDIVNDTPIDQLSQVIAGMEPADRERAKARLRGHKVLEMGAIAAEWREKQMPANMAQPMAVRIKMWDKTAVAGAWFLLDRSVPGHRAIRPGEIVVVDMAEPLIRQSFAKGFLEVVESAPTRPIVYAEQRHARLLDPIKRPGQRTPPAHIAAARDEAAELLAEIREQYAATQATQPQSDLPKAVQTQLRAMQLEKRVKAEFGEVDETEVSHQLAPDETPVKDEQSVNVRTRARPKK